METENISYKDALVKKKNFIYLLLNILTLLTTSLYFLILWKLIPLFPSLNDNHHLFNSKKIKNKFSPSRTKVNISLQDVKSYCKRELFKYIN